MSAPPPPPKWDRKEVLMAKQRMRALHQRLQDEYALIEQQKQAAEPTAVGMTKCILPGDTAYNQFLASKKKKTVDKPPTLSDCDEYDQFVSGMKHETVAAPAASGPTKMVRTKRLTEVELRYFYRGFRPVEGYEPYELEDGEVTPPASPYDLVSITRRVVLKIHVELVILTAFTSKPAWACQ